MLTLVFFSILSISMGILLLQVVIKYLVRNQIVATNYLEQEIPIGLGMYLWLYLIFYYFSIQWFIFPNEIMQVLISNYIVILTILFIVGWLDDRVGDSEVKGLRGHLMKLVKERRLTTGLLKAVSTGGLAVWVLILLEHHPLLEIIQFFILTLMTNGVNLLDLRPGRAIKFFLLLSSVLFLFTSILNFFLYLFPIVIAVLLLLPKDIQGKVMLGDSGSNLLGFVLGFCFIIMTPWWIQISVLILLVYMHWISEKSSITQWIQSKPFIHWIDQWGRV
ncbi:hypothetical protein [Chengkuizengella marina]|uniref:UDP-N-acetylmuramyl pentapeptide phosphotransferase/UDP-N-acetylglucosamine-1-phosphate transferase n=1 Tax=Chengkuizengella marina TaxID=2507566 RepID=A0A6N9PVS0_9BACL|nr:hypothetical protein [Chengkuizengella marina]NBI27631.1 hypothetical protein [Chengkuizengella marina]